MENLRRRGDLAIWIADDTADNWTLLCRNTRGGQTHYSDLAMDICPVLQVVFRLPLCQMQGFVRSVVSLMKFDIAVSDFSTLSR
ncbi:transposase [Ruegeria hyattellae]|uniref:transposase n=1 Tax=Ruegeria hyattellae TaxID=3233337 RepID=UPI00355B5438